MNSESRVPKGPLTSFLSMQWFLCGRVDDRDVEDAENDRGDKDEPELKPELEPGPKPGLELGPKPGFELGPKPELKLLELIKELLFAPAFAARLRFCALALFDALASIAAVVKGRVCDNTGR